VKRLNLNQLPIQADPVTHRNQILLQLAECLITDEGKRKASSILGAQTFHEMYQKSQRQQAQQRTQLQQQQQQQ
jgi:hypothetical protein